MIVVRLSDEEKLQVLLVALALFLAALLLSICLAATICPLNRWLSNRAERKRHRQQESAARYNAWSYQIQRRRAARASLDTNKPATPSSYVGPPPAYEAALRASRLQSLKGCSPAPPDWLQSALTCQNNETPGEAQLDLGDYFHPPKEAPPPFFGPSGHICSPALAELQPPPGDARQRQPPVMLRLWVCLMDPADLVARVRTQASTRGQTADSSMSGRRMSLARQLSIPHLFGSLMHLAGAKPASSGHPEEPAPGGEGPTSQAGAPTELSSLGSATTSSSGASQPEPAAGRYEQDTDLRQSDSTDEPLAIRHELGQTSRPVAGNTDEGRELAIGSITSRVLHMNVASFSFVKDETLISSKKHDQMNFQQFFAHQAKTTVVTKSTNKMCQLLVSVCDVENLLNSSWLNERACAKLAESSSVYVQCEILAARSKSARLLRNPLRAFQHRSSEAQSHTVDLGAAISAAAIEQPAPVVAAVQNQLHGQSADGLAGGRKEPAGPTAADPPGSPGDQDAHKGQHCTASGSTNWRHEPSADGKSIVVFRSVPKQIERQQQLAAASLVNQQAGADGCIDLVQFDSVFVSPILSKSLIEDGFLRLRVFSACKYVNETCLAELKLPLKQLVKAQTRDNLGDAASARPQPQADLILNNLLANLVTASTGSPLGALLEQVGAAEEQEPDAAGVEPAQIGAERLPSSPLGSSWPAAGNRLQRSYSSLGDALARFNGLRPAQPQADGQPGLDCLWQMECDRRIEQNYCRSLLVSHWLNYLVAPSYECQLVEEARGKLLLGLTYLPTSNRIIFNAHKATIDLDSLAPCKQLVKKLRLQSDTSYLLRFMMLANGRVLKRKQTAAAPRPEWDSQGAITFDLANVSVERPSFVVALVVRNGHACAPAALSSSLQSLPSPQYYHGPASSLRDGHQPAGARPPEVQSEPESLRHFGGPCRPEPDLARQGSGAARRARPATTALVIGHLVLADEIWNELRAQPRKQIVKQFKLV